MQIDKVNNGARPGSAIPDASNRKVNLALHSLAERLQGED